MSGQLEEFNTASVWMRKSHLIEVGAPLADVERIMAAVVAVDPLAVGPNYDQVAFQTASGIERYRPRAGAAAGTEAAVRLQAGPVTLLF